MVSKLKFRLGNMAEGGHDGKTLESTSMSSGSNSQAKMTVSNAKFEVENLMEQIALACGSAR